MLAIIGVVAAIAVPAFNNVLNSAKDATMKRHAQDIADISSQLAALEVVHVIPVSMGGVEATARYIREGITVYEGPYAGQTFVGPNLTDEEITEVARYLIAVYESDNLRLVFNDPGDS